MGQLDGRGLKKLAMRIIILAGQDWDYKHPISRRYIYRGLIRVWSKTPNFDLWCEAAGVDSMVIRSKFS